MLSCNRLDLKLDKFKILFLESLNYLYYKNLKIFYFFARFTTFLNDISKRVISAKIIFTMSKYM